MKEMVFRPSTLQERRKFYENEFSIQKVKGWFKSDGVAFPQICAIDAGSDTNVLKNKKWKGKLFYFPFKELKVKILKYIPEDIYYDRNVYIDAKKSLRKLKFGEYFSQELVFDIDSDNIACDHGTKTGVCIKCLKKAYDLTLKMKKELEENFKEIKIIYSGRGFHLHLLDKKAFLLTKREREKIAERYSKYPIDPWVSRGEISLIRMPFTLNSLVSRVALPLNKRFDAKESIPGFLK